MARRSYVFILAPENYRDTVNADGILEIGFGIQT